MMRCLLACLLLAAAGCSSTEQIRTAPPRPALPVEADPTPDEGRAPLLVVLERGPSPLPDAVESLRFRVAEVWLRSADGGWKTYPADVHQFTVGEGIPVRKLALSTEVPPAAYDSLGIVLGDAYVQFDANAGGPLTMPRGEPLKLPITLQPQVGRRTLLNLSFEPGASLSRDADCRWYFLPFFVPRVEP